MAAVRTSFKAEWRPVIGVDPSLSVHPSVGVLGLLPPLGCRDDAAVDTGFARLSEALLPPGRAGSCADVDSQTQELSPTALAGEVLGSLARGGGDGRAAQRPPPWAALSPSDV